MDFRQFLQGADSERRLPYAGGLKIRDDQRSWRLREELAPGWYRFREAGRYLEMIAPIEPELEAWELPTVRGYLAQDRFVTQDSMERLFGLPEDEEPPRYAPLSAKRWFDGRCWFSMTDFESEAEEQVRTGNNVSQPTRAPRLRVCSLLRGHVHVAPFMHQPVQIDEEDVFASYAELQQHIQTGDSRRAAAGRDDFDVFK